MKSMPARGWKIALFVAAWLCHGTIHAAPVTLSDSSYEDYSPDVEVSPDDEVFVVWERCTLSVDEFLRRFLQHVLPRGFVKVRYYGLLSHALQHLLPWIRTLLEVDEVLRATHSSPEGARPVSVALSPTLCPTCGQVMRRIQHLLPRSRGSPLAA